MATKKSNQRSTKTKQSVNKRNPGVKLVRTLRGHTGFIGRIAWSPDGRIIASPSEDGIMRLWNAQTGECQRTLELPGINSIVAFHPSGKTLAAGGQHQVVIWETATGRLLRKFKQLHNYIFSLAFDPAGHTLAIGGQTELIYGNQAAVV